MPAPNTPPQAQPDAVPELVAAVFNAAPLPERKRLLELMIRPLGVLSLAAVANGLFAQIALRSNWKRFQLQTEDVQNVKTDDVLALAHYVQQASSHAFDGMRQVLMGSPALMGTTATAVLLALLTKEFKRRTTRAATEEDYDPPL